jgi:molybdate transport system substrate-binding protein
VRSRSAVVVIALLVTACAGAIQPEAPTTDLTIYAAASLKAALDKVEASYEASNPAITLTVSTDASSALATMIEQGARPDLFMSADTATPQRLVDHGLAREPVITFARSRLTIIVPRANPAAIRTPPDLARSDVKVIAAGEAVPVTRYAEQLIAKLAALPGYPSDFMARYTANITSREDNVAAEVAKIELGEGDAAVVYHTDARASTRVTEIPVPDRANVAAIYGGVVLKSSPNQAAAGAFLAWLLGADGKAALASVGFDPP